MKLIIPIIFLFLIPIVCAETTFFDNPNDMFIYSNPASVASQAPSPSSGGGCLYKWNCTNWSECFPSGKQTRNCTNIGTCSDRYKTPETEQNCTYPTPEQEPAPGPEPVQEEEAVEEVPVEEIIEETPVKEIVDKNKTSIYFIIVLIILFIIFYLKKDYFKKLIQISRLYS